MPTLNWNTGLPGSVNAIANGLRFTGTTAQIQALLASVTVTPVANNGTDIGIRVISTTQESNPTEGGDVATLTATTTTNHTINMVPVADQPTVSSPGVGTPYLGEEDTRIQLSGAMAGALTGALTDTDGSETLSFRITGVPTGAAFFNAATGGAAAVDQCGGGVWTFTAAQFAAGIFFLPPSNFSGTLDMNVVSVATESENGVTAINTAPFRVIVDPQADQPTVSGSTTGNEDTSINFGLNITANPSDADGSEWVSSVTLSAFPASWAVSFTSNSNVTVTGTANGPYTLSVTSQAHAAALQTVLDSFRVTPPANSDANATIQVSATATDADGSTATRSGVNHVVTVRAVADMPTASASASTGSEDTPIDTNLSVAIGADNDGSETLSARILDVPAGATLTANTAGGGTFTDAGGGVWTITAPSAAQLDAIVQSIRFQGATHFSGDVTMRLEVTSTEAAANGGEVAAKTAVATTPFTVTVAGVADMPVLSVVNATGGAAGFEDSFIPLIINAQRVDNDGSETLTLSISGVPAGRPSGREGCPSGRTSAAASGPSRRRRSRASRSGRPPTAMSTSR